MNVVYPKRKPITISFIYRIKLKPNKTFKSLTYPYQVSPYQMLFFNKFEFYKEEETFPIRKLSNIE